MEYIKIELEVPKDMVPYFNMQDKSISTRTNALVLYPYIMNNTISHGKAAEILGINKIELIALYSQMGLDYLNADIKEVLEDADTISKIRSK